MRPLENPRHKGTPLSVARGQAETFFLTDPAGAKWILKKFRQDLGVHYLAAVGELLPRHIGFYCGTDRLVVKKTSLSSSNGCYSGRGFRDWLTGTVLMPRVEGIAWADLADELRSGERILCRTDRLRLCRNLSELIKLLEQAQCAHRDLSSGNVFICLTSGRVSLIDFDCLFHLRLVMPGTTTSGTEGYIAPFVWCNGRVNPETTWCPNADRFALALLNTEFLLLGKGSPLSADGGMFDQCELRNRHGKQLGRAAQRLKGEFSTAFSLFDTAMRSNAFPECPSPDAWIKFCDAAEKTKIPSLCEVETLDWADVQAALSSRGRRPASVGFLGVLVGKFIKQNRPAAATVSLPEDPWRN
ncbi:MAG: hypothetical protein B6D36_04450 [Planctomycetes bacterium UTPLA1]|nr:MAG: hypothetical protein B6D36_04450 [Planctomycetes bacterium UTPLA1]